MAGRGSSGPARWRETHAEAICDADVMERPHRHQATIDGLIKLDQLAQSINDYAV